MTAATSGQKKAMRIIQIDELASTAGKPGMLPVTPATIALWVSESKFPKPLRLSGSVVAWDLEEVECFISQLAKGSAQSLIATTDCKKSIRSRSNANER
jgi:predicted DNA-binding transcriptional regulator AlpA